MYSLLISREVHSFFFSPQALGSIDLLMEIFTYLEIGTLIFFSECKIGK